MFCNNDFLDFTGPLIHPHGTDITVKLFHFLPASHALSPVQLQSLVDDNAAAIAWLAEHVREGDAVLLKASRGARLDEVAATLK